MIYVFFFLNRTKTLSNKECREQFSSSKVLWRMFTSLWTHLFSHFFSTSLYVISLWIKIAFPTFVKNSYTWKHIQSFYIVLIHALKKCTADRDYATTCSYCICEFDNRLNYYMSMQQCFNSYKFLFLTGTSNLQLLENEKIIHPLNRAFVFILNVIKNESSRDL